MYGLAEGLERKESDPLHPVTNYSRSKMMAEEALKPLATDLQPLENLDSTIKNLKKCMTGINFKSTNFRNSKYIRFNVLDNLVESSLLRQDLIWKI